MHNSGSGVRVAKSVHAVGLVFAAIAPLRFATCIAGDQPESVPAEVARDIEQIRRELGGSAVEKFESLSEPNAVRGSHGANARGGPNSHQAHGSNSPNGGRRIAVLRRAAQELDLAANRVEEIEAYAEADTIRSTAQRLRAFARDLALGDAERSARVEPIMPVPRVENGDAFSPTIVPAAQ